MRDDMKRMIGGLAIAGAAVVGTVGTASPAVADPGGRCQAYIDVNCTFWNGWYYEQCDLWWAGRCYIEVT